MIPGYYSDKVVHLNVFPVMRTGSVTEPFS